MKKTLVIGGVTIDSFCQLPPDKNNNPSFNKFELEFFSQSIGGGGANVSCSLARLGADVSLAYRVGKDENGKMVKSHLEQNGVSTSLQQIDPTERTGVALIFKNNFTNNSSIYAYRGANSELGFSKYLSESLSKYSGLYLSTMVGTSRLILDNILSKKNISQTIAINPGMSQLDKPDKYIIPYLYSIDIYISNLSESISLWNHLNQSKSILINKIDSDSDSIIEFLAAFTKHLHEFGPTLIAVTLGEKGVFLSSSKYGHKLYKSISNHVVDDSGAGDALGSTLFHCITLGIDLDTAIKCAQINASSVIGYADTQSGLLSMRDILIKVREPYYA